MNKKVNVYFFNDECYVYLNDYEELQQKVNQLETNRDEAINKIYNTTFMTSRSAGKTLFNTFLKELVKVLERGKDEKGTNTK